MEIEYGDPARRSRFIVIIGLLLALIAGGAAFLLINQAQREARLAGVETQLIVVAARDIPARKPIEVSDVELREVPVDDTTVSGVFTEPAKIVGLVTSVPILAGQPVYANFLAGQAQGAQFSIMDPTESIAPDTPFWRAVAITVPDDRAVGGLVESGNAVDVVVTAQITLPTDLVEKGRYYSDRSTKVVYQDMVVLAKSATTYVVKAPIEIAEEISHFQASGVASFTLLMRPDQDLREVDVSRLGTTTNRIIARYGLPLPEVYPAGAGPLPLPTAAAEPEPTPLPEETVSTPTTPTP
jgi:Flp pilus assembly protein CpaB